MTEVYKCSLCKDGNLEATLDEHKKHLEEFHKINVVYVQDTLGFTYQIYDLTRKERGGNDLLMKTGKKLGDLTFKGMDKGMKWLESGSSKKKEVEQEAKT